MDVTSETRLEAFRALDRQKRYAAILEALDGRPMTAREVARALGFYERNAAAPRLTELERKGIVEIVGKKKDDVTGKTVAVYGKVV